MRTFGMPSASTVASAMAFGSFGSAASAALNHSAKTPNGSVAATKSPSINEDSALYRPWLRVRSSYGVLHFIYRPAGAPLNSPVRGIAAAFLAGPCADGLRPYRAAPWRRGRSEGSITVHDGFSRSARRSRTESIRATGRRCATTLGQIPARAAAGTSIDWWNDLTNSTGTVSTLTPAATHDGSLCRRFATTINDLRGIRRYRGLACRSGEWLGPSKVGRDEDAVLL